MRSPTLVREIEVLQRFSEQANAKACKALDFNGFKPMICRGVTGMWVCQGMHPHGLVSIGYGDTPEEAYIDWTYDHIPF